MSYTLGMSARATGLSKSTVYRAIKAGRISATRTDIGEWAIDPAELHRVFPPIEPDDHAFDNGCVTTAASPEIALRNARLEAELAASAQVGDLLRQQLDETRRDRDHWRGQATRLVLPAPASAVPAAGHANGQPARMGLVARLFGFA
jgi:excisionase family DNA binding protein